MNCKISIAGNSNSGKSALCNRFMNGNFTYDAQSTIGASFTKKLLDDVNLEIWDTAGQERYRSLVGIYFRNTKFVILTFDLNNIQSFNECNEWIKICKRQNIQTNQIILVGCKSDLPIVVHQSKIDDLCEQHGFEYISTSSKKDINITEVFITIINRFKQTYYIDPTINWKQGDSIRLMEKTPSLLSNIFSGC
jgi:small GTP-binding protein